MTARRQSGRRIIRQPSFLEKVSDLPFTLQLKVEEWWDELDFSDFGYPIGVALNGSSFLIKLGTLTAHWATSGRDRLASLNPFSSEESQAEQRLEKLNHVKAGGLSIGTYLSILLLLLSIANAAYSFTRKRTYQLRNRSELVNSSNAYWVETELQDRPGLFTRFKEMILGFFGETPEKGRIQQLDVWTPDNLTLRIFILYPPPVSLLWFLLDGSNWWFMLIAIGLSLAQTNLIVRQYSNLIKDRGYVQAEVMHEYDKSFVFPRVFKPVRSVGVMTNEAEMVSHHRPYRGRHSFVKEEPSYNNEDDYGSFLKPISGIRKSRTSSSIATQASYPQEGDGVSLWPEPLHTGRAAVNARRSSAGRRSRDL